MDPANFAELRNNINSWDITAEELLLQKMKIFTINYNEEFQQFCKNLDNFSNSIDQVEIDHLKAINQIKTISLDKFVENTLDKGEESESESVSNENNLGETIPREVQISSFENMKTAIDISLNCLNEINKKNKNKEEIEDDSVSVVSSKITMDKGAKVRLPFVIGTDEFKADKAIGLNVALEEDEKKPNEENEDEEDSDVEEYLAGINVDRKQKEKWEKIKIKKQEELKIKREMERKKLEASKTFANNIPKNEESDVKLPIENELDNLNMPKDQKDPNAIGVISADPAKLGGAVPPPQPPPAYPQPPADKIEDTVIKPNINISIKNPYAKDDHKVQVDIGLNPEENQPQPQELKTQVNPYANKNNVILENPNIGNNSDNIPISVLDILHTEADNKNPLAPVSIDKNMVVNKDNVKIATFLQNSDFLGGQYDDEDDDYDDLSSNIFRKKPSQIKIPPQQENPQNNQKLEENPQINQNQGQPIMIMGIPRPQPQAQKPIHQINQIHQMPMMQHQMIKPAQIDGQINQEQANQINQLQQPIQMQAPQPQINQSQFNLFQTTPIIEIKPNRQLENAGNKLKNMFESSDEEEMAPSNIVDKTADITLKVSLFTQSNIVNESKFNLFDDEPKQNEIKHKKQFLEDDEEPKIENNKVNENINVNVNTNFNLEQEKPKLKINLFNEIDKEPKNENKIKIEKPNQKPNLAFFNDDDNPEPVKEKQKLSFFNEEEKEKKSEENQNEKQQPSFINAQKEKILSQNETKVNQEQIKENVEIPVNTEQEIKKKEPIIEKIPEQQFQPKITVPKPELEIMPKVGFLDTPHNPQKIEPQIIMPKPEVQNKEQLQPQPPINLPKPEVENRPKIGLFENNLEMKPKDIQQKEEIKKELPKEELKKDEKKNEELKAKTGPKVANNKFAAMQNMLANRMGQKGGMMMMMGGPPPKKEEVKIEHDENVSERGTGENNYEAVVKKTSIIKKKKPKRSGAFGAGTTIPAKTAPSKVESKQQTNIENQQKETKPKVDLFNIQIQKEEAKPKVDQQEEKEENRPKIDLLNIQIQKEEVKPKVDQQEKKEDIKPKLDLFNFQIQKKYKKKKPSQKLINKRKKKKLSQK